MGSVSYNDCYKQRVYVWQVHKDPNNSRKFQMLRKPNKQFLFITDDRLFLFENENLDLKQKLEISLSLISEVYYIPENTV